MAKIPTIHNLIPNLSPKWIENVNPHLSPKWIDNPHSNTIQLLLGTHTAANSTIAV